jgi:hypothetical protein
MAAFSFDNSRALGIVLDLLLLSWILVDRVITPTLKKL